MLPIGGGLSSLRPLPWFPLLLLVLLGAAFAFAATRLLGSP